MPAVLPFDLRAYRPGQGGAHLTVVDRLLERASYTAIVAPCGYGKSDLIRMISIEAWYKQLIACSLVLSPNEILRDQLVAPTKFQACLARYKVTLPGIKYRVLPSEQYVPERDFTSNGEMLVSTTMQLVQNNVAFFCQWVDSQLHRTGIPPLICIDEAQTESVENTWGHAVAQLVTAGARALLLTATPTRSDHKPIPGFSCEEIDAQDILHQQWKNTEDPLIKEKLIYAAVERTFALTAHHTTTFRQAWAEGAIAQVERFPYDAYCEELTALSTLGRARLSDIPSGRILDYLGKIVREPVVMREGVKRFAESLAVLQQVVREAAGIIFVSNDTDPDGVVNAHAKAVERLLLEYQPHWKVLIATASNGKTATTDITRFANEELPYGDVLIVKQMAGRGVDPPRCKVLLDLSPVRAEAGWIQRVMRINRVYKNLRGLYISVDDVVSRELWETIVQLQGGASQTYRDIGELLESYRYRLEERPEYWRALFIDETTSANFSDSNETHATADDQPIMRHLRQIYPTLALHDTHSGLAAALRGWEPPDDWRTPAAERTDVRIQDERIAITQVVQRITRRRLGTHVSDNAAYSVMIKQVWVECKKAVGIDPSLELKNVEDLQALARFKKHVLAREQQEKKRYE